jgi:hypothetical protein
MVTMGNTPTLGQFILMKLAAKRERRREESQVGIIPRTYMWFSSIVRLMAQLAGFSLLTIAGFEWHIIAGYVIAGLSCFVFSWLQSGTNHMQPQPPAVDPLLRR